MRARLLILGVVALLLVPTGSSAPVASSTPKATSAFVSLTITGTKFRVTGTNLTPGSYAGALLAYRDYARTTSTTARVNVAGGRIQTDTNGDFYGNAYLYEVDEGGHVTIAGSTNIFTGGHIPGRLVVQLATTAGEMVDAEADIG